MRPSHRLLIVALLASACAFDVLGPARAPRDVDDETDAGSEETDGGAEETDAGTDGGTGCTPNTLACVGRCGELDDGCGTVNCGGCPEPTTCGGGGRANECGCNETDASFCARQGKTCGTAQGTDRCGRERVVNCGVCECVPESKAEFCTRGGARCGAFNAKDNCERDRTEACGDCPGGLSCGASHLCECVPESAAAFCARLGKTCGRVSGADNCSGARTEECGTCATGFTCNVAHTCACVPETNAAFCTRLGKNCGNVTAPDNCGTTRVAPCGSCSQTCTQNVCTCVPLPDAEICEQQLADCGEIEETDVCNVTRLRSCGTCTQGSCVDNRCSCGPSDWSTSLLDGPGYGANVSIALRGLTAHVAYTDNRTAGSAKLRYARRGAGSTSWAKETILDGTLEVSGTIGIGASYTDSMVRIAAVANTDSNLRVYSRTGTSGPWGYHVADTQAADWRANTAIRVDFGDSWYLAWRAAVGSLQYVRTSVTTSSTSPPDLSYIPGGTLWSLDLDYDEAEPQVYPVISDGVQYGENVAVLRRGATQITRDSIGAGTLASIALDDQKGLHVLYVERPTVSCLVVTTPCATTVKYAYKAAGAAAWTITTAATLASHPAGHALRLKRGPGGRLHGLVYEFAAKKLTYLYKPDATAAWSTGTVSTGVALENGFDLGVDANSGVHVVYTESGALNARYAYKCPL